MMREEGITHAPYLNDKRRLPMSHDERTIGITMFHLRAKMNMNETCFVEAKLISECTSGD